MVKKHIKLFLPYIGLKQKKPNAFLISPVKAVFTAPQITQRQKTDKKIVGIEPTIDNQAD